MRFRPAQDCRRLLAISAVLVLCLVPLNADHAHVRGERPPLEENLATTDPRGVTDRPIEFNTGEQLKREADREDRELRTQLGGLISALQDFASTYNSGHVIDVRKVRAVQKAMRQLEKSEWFRSQKER